MGTSEQHYCLRWNNHHANMITVFQELYQNGALTDVTIGLSDGLLVECHKLVLAACSSYFRKILQNLNRPRALILVNVKYYQMKAILEYMYHGEVSVTTEELPALLEIANYLKIKGLTDVPEFPDSSSRSSSPCAQTRQSQTQSQSHSQQQQQQQQPQHQNSHQQRRSRRDQVSPSSPSPAITTSCMNYLAANSDSIGNGNGNNRIGDHTSPPHSTSSPYYNNYRKSPARAHSESRFPTAPGWNLPFVGSHFASSLHQGSSMSAHHASLLAAHYENDLNTRKNKLPNYMMGRDTPILRTVLGQGNADSSQGAVPLIHADNQEYRSPSNHSANDNTDSRRNSMSLSQGRSPYDTVVNDSEKKLSPRMRSTAEPNREWKRYKQYTKEDIASAIEAVRNGMSALQASRQFHVPSRTLYDKVKKLGIANTRSMRRSSNHSGASFPYGIGGNVNGSIYASMSDNDYDNKTGVFESPSAIIEQAYAKSRENSNDRDSAMEISRVTPTPSPSPNRSIQSAGHNQQEVDMEDQVEDLSMSSRKSDVRVIVSPVIKEEKPDPDNVHHK
ncbi:probable serine/threonine-protein kinase MARK-A isoform X1 [Microplitis demolitor]|uniref:probable serine/threonine-protein kinase MARK-A isoform X1 n=1 Tax=Microplitis demolitor TaxID=69319 RepID=UPI0004CD0C32|nr:probable serine/threonine-protein kinase MARK-A isoform X1 [Microplitis demolitor]